MFNLILAAVTVVQGIFILVSLIAASDSKDVLNDVYWTKVHGYDGNAYWGLFTVYEDTDFGSATVDYRSGDCMASVCNDCNDAGQGTTALLVLSLVGLGVTLLFHILRVFSSFNTRFMKTATSVSLAFASVSAAIATIVWGSQCQNNLVDYYDGDTITMGPAYGLTLAVVFISIIALFLDLFLTTPLPPNPNALGAPLNPSAPPAAGGAPVYAPYGMAPAPFAPVPPKPAYCAFCGKVHVRDAPSHPEEVARFCPSCGRRHVILPDVKFCGGCGGELRN